MRGRASEGARPEAEAPKPGQEQFGWLPTLLAGIWAAGPSSPSPQPPCPLCPVQGLTPTPVLKGLPPAPKLVPCSPSLHPGGEDVPTRQHRSLPSAEPGGMGQATRRQHKSITLTVDMNSRKDPLSRARPSPPLCDGHAVCPPKQVCPWRGSPGSPQAWLGTWDGSSGDHKFRY